MSSSLSKSIGSLLALLAVVGVSLAALGAVLYGSVVVITSILGVSDVTALLIVAAALLVLDWASDDVPVTIGERPPRGNPPPEVSAIKKMNLLMPVRVGQHGPRPTWPPFWGHRFPLGCRL